MQRVRAGTAICALCHQALRPDADAVITPDFLASDADPFFPFSDATMHRGCFSTWDQRKAFISHFNRIARTFVAEDGTYLQMSGDGELVQHHGAPPPRGPAA